MALGGMAHLLQRGYGLGGDAALIDQQIPLIVTDAGAGNCLFQTHAMVDDFGNDLHHGGNDADAAGGAQHSEGLAILQQEGGRHTGQGHLSAGHRVGRGGIHGEVIHVVVEQKAGAFGHHAGAEHPVDGPGDSHQIALVIRNGEVGGGGTLVLPRIAAGDLLGTRRIYTAHQFLGVCLAEQTFHGHLDKVGVAHILGPVGIAQLEYLREQVQVFGAVDLHGGDIKVLQHVEDLADVHTAGRGRRRGNDLIPPIGGSHRGQHTDVELLQIGVGHDAAGLLYLPDDTVGNVTLVKSIPAALGDFVQRVGKIGIADLAAHGIGLAVLQIDFPAIAVLLQLLLVGVDICIQIRGHQITRPGQFSGG